ncbi:hypothetical protein [Rubritalea squalenifaciens]|nr:hypothetical protein [Rubritalea squalenifaciens]
MKTIWMLWMSVLMLGVATAGELPEVYKPFEKILGTWQGESVSEVTLDGEKQENTKILCRESYRYDEKLGVIVGEQEGISELNGEKQISLFRFVVAWDEKDQVFRGMMWLSEKVASHYEIKFKEGVLLSKGVSGKEGDEVHVSTVLEADEVLRSKGMLKFPAEKVEVKWVSTLKKVKP